MWLTCVGYYRLGKQRAEITAQNELLLGYGGPEDWETARENSQQ